MGNLCSKSDSDDNFSTPGRPLGRTPDPPPKRVSVPSSQTVGGPGRTVGGGGGGGGGGQSGDARSRAAEAAEARANPAGKPKGKLAAQLDAQKKQTRNETLQEASRDELRARDADEAAEARAYN